MKKRKSYYIFLILLLFSSSVFSSELILEEKLLEIVSNDLMNKCNSRLKKLENNPDSADMSFPIACLVRDYKVVKFQNNEYHVVVAGCVGDGEVFIINPLDTSIIVKSDNINFPTHYIEISDVIDINNDSIPELVIHQGSGSHGIYAIFLSIGKGNLIPILNENNVYQFYASGGSIDYKDLDNDGTLEILLEQMLYSGNNKDNQPSQKVLKWDGSKYCRNEYLESIK